MKPAMKPARFCPAALPGLSLLSLLLFAPFAHAQMPATSVPPTLKKPVKTVPKSPNVKPGELVALNAEDGTLQLKDKLGKTTAYAVTEKTRFLKGKREVEASAFKPGEAIVVHIRKARDGGDAQAVEVADKASWAWLEDVKRSMTEAIITSVEDDELTVAVGAEKIPLAYKVSDKTTWSRNGKSASASDFKAGEKVCVIPRSLPSGAIMARAVSDTPQAAAQLKERQATSLHGVIKTVDAAGYKLMVETTSSDMRLVQGNAETEVVQKSKAMPWTALHPGQHVGARLRHDYAGDAICWRITIETGKTVKTKKLLPVKTTVKH